MIRSLVASVTGLMAALVMSIGAGAPASAHETDADRIAPPELSPSSTSWTSPSAGWVFGWSACGPRLCPTLLHTEDGGASWSERETPEIRPSDVGNRVRVFFAERNGRSIGLITDGHALHVTYDAARTWQPLTLSGAESIGGIGANDRSVFVVGHAQVGDEVSMQAFASPIHHPRWHPLRGVSSAGPGSLYSTKSVVTGSGRGVQISTATYGGVVRLWTALNGHRFEPAYPCNPLSVMYPGVGAEEEQYVLCSSNPGRGRMAKLVRTGSPADRFTTIAGEAPLAGITSDFAVSPTSTLAIGATMNSAGLVHMSFDGGKTWETPLVAYETGAVQDLSFQDARHGVLVAGHGASGWSTVYRTTDGGHTWAAVDL